MAEKKAPSQEASAGTCSTVLALSLTQLRAGLFPGRGEPSHTLCTPAARCGPTSTGFQIISGLQGIKETRSVRPAEQESGPSAGGSAHLHERHDPLQPGRGRLVLRRQPLAVSAPRHGRESDRPSPPLGPPPAPAPRPQRPLTRARRTPRAPAPGARPGHSRNRHQ